MIKVNSVVKILVALLALNSALFAEQSTKNPESVKEVVNVKPEVRINVLGYEPNSTKRAVVVGDIDTLKLLNFLGVVKGTYIPQNKAYWVPGKDSTQVIDFSDLTEKTRVAFYHGKKRVSLFFDIREDVYDRMAKASIKAFYYNRASVELKDEFAKKWSRKAGHPDTLVKFHASSGETGTHSSPLGWYDAGDYGKYIVNSGIATYTLLMAYENYPVLYDTLSLNIPESKNETSDLLDEIKFNLDWMMTMQAKDGGVWHKLTALRFNGSEMPEEDNAERYIIGKGTAASLDFAFVMAKASRIYKKVDPDYAAQCLKQAKEAFNWAKANPNKYYRQPSDVQTGEYGDFDFGDEFVVASAELYRSTGDPSYLEHFDTKFVEGCNANWRNVSQLGLYTMVDLKEEGLNDSPAIWAKEILLSHGDSLLKLADNSGHFLPMTSVDFNWGSNSGAANQGITLLKAYQISGDKKYLIGAQSVLDYLLGMNPFNSTFVTGHGEKSPMNPHHRPSEADKIGDPVPGFLVGGPHNGGQDVGNSAWHCKDYVSSEAKSWVDWRCSYATNEVAINWNAPLAYLSWGVIESWKALRTK